MTAKDICTEKIIELYRQLTFAEGFNFAELQQQIETQIREWEAIIAKEKAVETLTLRS